jgi:hypothetical protein
MQYAAHLPSSRSMIAPVLALAIGAAGATGLYAALDGKDVQLRPAHVIVTETPAAPTGAVAAKDEAATAAAIARPSAVPLPWSRGKVQNLRDTTGARP